MNDPEANPYGIKLRYAATKTNDLTKSLRFYEGILGMAPAFVQPGAFAQLAGEDGSFGLDLSTDADAPSAVYSVEDLDGLCRSFETTDVNVVEGGAREGYVIVKGHDGTRVVFEAA